MGKIDKNVVMLGWASYFTDFASAMVNPVLPIFVVSILHEGVDKLGFIVAAATFVSYLLRIFSGYIADRFGVVKPLVASGYLLSAVTKPLLGFSEGYKSIALIKSAERFGKGVRSAPKDLMIAHYSKKEHSGKTFGFHKTLDIAGELSGTLFLFFLLYFFGQGENVIRNIFFFTLIPGMLGLFFVVFFVKDIPKPSHKESALRFSLTPNDKKTVSSLIFYFVFSFFIFNDAFFTLQAKSVGIETLYIPLLFVVSTFTQTLTSYYFGVKTDKKGVRQVMLFAYVSGVIAELLLYLQTPVATWVAYAFLGLFTVASLNANRAYIAKNADNRAFVYGIFYAGIAFFAALGAYLMGFIWEHVGMQQALELSLGVTFFITFVFLFKKEERKEIGK